MLDGEVWVLSKRDEKRGTRPDKRCGNKNCGSGFEMKNLIEFLLAIQISIVFFGVIGLGFVHKHVD